MEPLKGDTPSQMASFGLSVVLAYGLIEPPTVVPTPVPRMRIIASQFGVLFALLAFSSQLLAGTALGVAAVAGFLTGLAILASILLLDAAVDRFLKRKYGGSPSRGEDLPMVVQHGNSTPHSDGGTQKAA